MFNGMNIKYILATKIQTAVILMFNSSAFVPIN